MFSTLAENLLLCLVWSTSYIYIGQTLMTAFASCHTVFNEKTSVYLNTFIINRDRVQKLSFRVEKRKIVEELFALDLC